MNKDNVHITAWLVSKILFLSVSGFEDLHIWNFSTEYEFLTLVTENNCLDGACHQFDENRKDVCSYLVSGLTYFCWAGRLGFSPDTLVSSPIRLSLHLVRNHR